MANILSIPVVGKHTMMICKENAPKLRLLGPRHASYTLRTISDILFLVVLSTLPFVSLDICQITVKYNSIVLCSLTLFIIVDALGMISYLHNWVSTGAGRLKYIITILYYTIFKLCEHFNANVSIFKHACFCRFYSIFNILPYGPWDIHVPNGSADLISCEIILTVAVWL